MQEDGLTEISTSPSPGRQRPSTPPQHGAHSHPIAWWKLLLLAAGPGLVVMLADTDAGSVITAAQSGARYGYQLLWLQVALVPVLYLVQELTVRLGLATGKGHGELIRDRFGATWAWLSASTLVISCIGALVTEFVGLEGVGLLFGIRPWISVALAGAFLIVVSATGAYRQVESVALALGCFELAFVGVAVVSHPSAAAMTRELAQGLGGNAGYWFLVAGNIGAVIMPWMIFYQQSAIIDKGLGPKHLKSARIETAAGAVITQAIMAAVLITAAAALAGAAAKPLDTVPEIARALTPVLGPTWGRVVFSLGMVGAAAVAAIVVSLTAAWGLGEVAGYKRSLAHTPFEAPWFYAVFVVCVVVGGGLVLAKINLVELAVMVEVMNALLLPLVLGMLYLLALKALPDGWRLGKWRARLTGAVVVITSAVGLGAGLFGLLHTAPGARLRQDSAVTARSRATAPRAQPLGARGSEGANRPGTPQMADAPGHPRHGGARP